MKAARGQTLLKLTCSLHPVHRAQCQRLPAAQLLGDAQAPAARRYNTGSAAACHGILRSLVLPLIAGASAGVSCGTAAYHYGPGSPKTPAIAAAATSTAGRNVSSASPLDTARCGITSLGFGSFGCRASAGSSITAGPHMGSRAGSEDRRPGSSQPRGAADAQPPAAVRRPHGTAMPLRPAADDCMRRPVDCRQRRQTLPCDCNAVFGARAE